MPIYEYYCPDNHTIYQFFAKTLAQGGLTPTCPDNPAYRMERMLSAFAITGKRKESGAAEEAPGVGGPEGAEDSRMEAALGSMEKEFSSIDENDPRAMGRMMRRMAELTGEKIDGEMEEVVRKLEEGADPEGLEEQLGGGEASDPDSEMGEGGGMPGGMPGAGEKEPKEARHRYRQRRAAPFRDPQLYDYSS